MDKEIEYILEVARCGGITKAAEDLFITPSVLSKFVQTREAELQVKLFHRVGKRFILTQAGEYYVQKIGEVERTQRELSAQMSSSSNMSRDVICTDVQATFTEVIFHFVLPKLKEAFPGIRILIHEHTVGELIQMIRGRQLDVLLAVIDKQGHGFYYETVHQCELMMTAVDTHPMVQRAAPKPGFRYPWIDLSHCCDQPNVMLMPGSPCRAYADNLCGYYQLKPDIAYELGSSRSSLAYVAYTHTLMITLDHMIFNNLFHGEIVPLSVGEKPLSRNLVTAHLEEPMLAEESGVFHRICKKHIRQSSNHSIPPSGLLCKMLS